MVGDALADASLGALMPPSAPAVSRAEARVRSCAVGDLTTTRLTKYPELARWTAALNTDGYSTVSVPGSPG